MIAASARHAALIRLVLPVDATAASDASFAWVFSVFMSNAPSLTRDPVPKRYEDSKRALVIGICKRRAKNERWQNHSTSKVIAHSMRVNSYAIHRYTFFDMITQWKGIAMEQKAVQINVRIEESLKSAGDEAFARANASPSQAVRWLWAFAAAHADDGALERMLSTDPELAQVAEMPPQRSPQEKIASLHELQGSIAALTAQYPQHVIDKTNAIPDEELLADAMLEKHFEGDGV